MSSLIACLYMEEYEVLLLQLVECSLCFTLIVGIPETSCTFNLDDVETCIVSDATDKVNGRLSARFTHR